MTQTELDKIIEEEVDLFLEKKSHASLLKESALQSV